MNFTLEAVEEPGEDIDPAMRAYAGMKYEIAKKISEIWAQWDTEESEGVVVNPAVHFYAGLIEVKRMAADLTNFSEKHRLRLEAGPGDPKLDQTQDLLRTAGLYLAQVIKDVSNTINGGIPPEYRTSDTQFLEDIMRRALNSLPKEDR